MNNKVHKDASGKEISLGDTVMYPRHTQRGSSTIYTYGSRRGFLQGKVIKILPKTIRIDTGGKRQRRLRNGVIKERVVSDWIYPENIIIVEKNTKGNT